VRNGRTSGLIGQSGASGPDVPGDPLSLVDAQYCNSLGFAGLLRAAPALRSATAAALVSQTAASERRSGAGSGGNISDAALYPRCLVEREEPKLAGSYARTVSEKSAVVTASVGLFFAAKLPTQFLKFLPPLGPSGWDPSVATWIGAGWGPRGALRAPPAGWGETGPRSSGNN
jgi:hypothetical protein